MALFFIPLQISVLLNGKRRSGAQAALHAPQHWIDREKGGRPLWNKAEMAGRFPASRAADPVRRSRGAIPHPIERRREGQCEPVNPSCVPGGAESGPGAMKAELDDTGAAGSRLKRPAAIAATNAGRPFGSFPEGAVFQSAVAGLECAPVPAVSLRCRKRPAAKKTF